MTSDEKRLLLQRTDLSLRELISKVPPISPEEKAARMRGQQLLKERLSSIPFHQRQAKKYGEEHWARLHDSSILG